MIAVDQIPLQSIEAQLSKILGSTAQRSAIAGATVAEHIRACLTGAINSNPVNTVHTTRLLSNARRAFRLAWPNTSDDGAENGARDFCSDILDRIHGLGDAWQAGRGQWIPTPLRAVAIDASNRCLIVGSTPLAVAQKRLNTKIACAGASRFATVDQSKEQSGIQTIDTWLGATPTLSDWTARMLEEAKSRMVAVGGLAADHLEIYAPDILRSQRRPNRWIACTDVSHAPPEILLCRPKLAYAAQYDRPHYLAQFAFRHGGLVLERQAQVPHSLSLRLRFGLDQRLGMPRPFEIHLAGDAFRIERSWRLPDPESRVYALGWPDPHANGTSEALTFHKDALPILSHALKRLAVEISTTRRSLV